MKIALVSAKLGNFDKAQMHVDQSLSYDSFLFTDENFPPRHKAMTSRLQAKIPKFFAWQLKPGYDYYIWLDGNITLTHPDSLKLLLESCLKHDFAVIRHPRRPNIRQEARYLRKGLREQSIYLTGRYDGEWTPDQVVEMNSNKNFVDDLLVLGGVFIYKNTPAVQAAMKEWWYLTSRYSVFDQLAFAYVLKTTDKLKVKVIDSFDGEGNSLHFKLNGHNRRDK